MEGRIGAEALAETWGAAAPYARRQAEVMMAYRSGRIEGVQIAAVTWQMTSCRMRREGGMVRAAVRETWRYEADLACASGGTRRSTWVEVFAHETYALIQAAGGWRVDSWLSGPAEVEQQWACR